MATQIVNRKMVGDTEQIASWILDLPGFRSIGASKISFLRQVRSSRGTTDFGDQELHQVLSILDEKIG
ncbi:MAG: hypothetical protein ACU843_18985 [Gammaproteobacteria bacterium]